MKKLVMLVLIVGVSFMVGGATCSVGSIPGPVKNVICADTTQKIAEATEKFNQLTAFDAWLMALPYGIYVPAIRAGIASALAVYAQLRQGLCVDTAQVVAAENVLLESKYLAKKLKYKGFDK